MKKNILFILIFVLGKSFSQETESKFELGFTYFKFYNSEYLYNSIHQSNFLVNPSGLFLTPNKNGYGFGLNFRYLPASGIPLKPIYQIRFSEVRELAYCNCFACDKILKLETFLIVSVISGGLGFRIPLINKSYFQWSADITMNYNTSINEAEYKYYSLQLATNISYNLTQNIGIFTRLSGERGYLNHKFFLLHNETGLRYRIN